MDAIEAPRGWPLPPLSPDDCGPYGDFPRLDNAAKDALWHDYHAGRAPRTPILLSMNDRVFVLDPQFNTLGLTYTQIVDDPACMLQAMLCAQHVMRSRYHEFCDLPTGLPELWQVRPMFHNTFDASAFGAALTCPDNDVPTTTPIVGDADKQRLLDVDLTAPLTIGTAARGIEMTHAMRALAEGKTFLDRPIEVLPYAELGCDGPLTVALNLRGPGIFLDLRRDPDFAHALFERIVTAATQRFNAFLDLWDLPAPDEVWFADDALATIGVSQYREHVLPHHRRWYDALDPTHTRKRGMHLCGDATRHFPTIADELGVTAFDTGFPVDHGALRATLGDRIELIGGVPVPLLQSGPPQAVYDAARAILASGVCSGGRFILREANNLPPSVPWPSLAAMAAAAHAATS